MISNPKEFEERSPWNWLGIHWFKGLVKFFKTVTIDRIGTSDPALSFYLDGTAKFTLGVDDSDSDKFKISGSSAVGTTDRLTIDSSGNVVVGGSSNYTSWDSTGHLTMAGTARPWRDELGDAINLKSQGPGVSVSATESVVEFIHTAQVTDYLYTNVQLNHDKDLAASIYPHIHFFQAENAAPNFMLQYRWQKNGATKVTDWTNYKCNSLSTAYSSGTIHQIAYGAAIAAPSGTALSDIVQFRIIRDHDNASTLFTGQDPYTATVGVLSFDVHFMTNSLGSTDEYTK